MQKKKILILYTSIGLGHKSIAENICFYLSGAGYDVKLFDAHKIQNSKLINGGGKIYPWLLRKLPFIWDWFYNTRWFISLTLPFRIWIASFNYNHILEKINEIKPDLIISTHNTSSAVVSYLRYKGLYQGRFGIAFSDFHLHRFWVFKNADFFLANIEEQKLEMVALGISSEKIFVCGVVLKPKSVLDRSVVMNELNIPANNKVVLFSSGSQGIGLNAEVLAELVKLPDVTIIAVCGKDVALAKEYNERFGPKVIAFAYYSPMEHLYAIADIFVTKPGGLSSAEALAWTLPQLVFYVLPGGERYNYNYLLDKNLVLPTPGSLPEFSDMISQELRTCSFRKSLRTNRNLEQILKDPQVLIDAVEAYLK